MINPLSSNVLHTSPLCQSMHPILYSWLKEFASKRWSYNVPKKKLFSGVMRAHSWMHAYDNQWNPVDTIYSTPLRYDAIQGASLVRVTLWDPLCFNSISNYYSHNSKRAHPNIHNNKVSAPRFSSSQGVGTPSSVVWALSLLPVHVTPGEFRKSIF